MSEPSLVLKKLVERALALLGELRLAQLAHRLGGLDRPEETARGLFVFHHKGIHPLRDGHHVGRELPVAVQIVGEGRHLDHLAAGKPAQRVDRSSDLLPRLKGMAQRHPVHVVEIPSHGQAPRQPADPNAPAAEQINVDINGDGVNEYVVAVDQPTCITATPIVQASAAPSS